MPTKPKRPPNSRMENSTQKEASPVESPRILGPRMLPSNCWSTKMKMTKYRHFRGLTSRISSAQGMAPMKGPKNGMMLVTPMITANSIGYGNRNRLQHTRAIMPMIRESTSLPLINPLRMR